MLLIFVISCFISLMVFLKSPLMGALSLILISCFMGIYISMFSSKWMAYLIILLFLGGMMVLFVYVCTLISNFKNSIKNSSTWWMLLFLMMFMLSTTMFLSVWDFKLDMKNMFLSVMYINSNFLLTLVMVVYLLWVLVISIKICQKFKGGLKSKIYEF